MKPLAIVVCVAERGVIGKDGALPWRLPEDLAHFKAVTMGHAIVMGRKTHASIGRALPGRRNIVVTRDPTYAAPGCEVVGSLGEALAAARLTDAEPCVIGGASLYEEALPMTTKIHLSRLRREVDGDTFFPLAALDGFEVESRVPVETPDLEISVLVRKETARA